MPNLSAKELQELDAKLKQVTPKITKQEIANRAQKSERYVKMVFNVNDERYSEAVISAARQLIIERSNASLTKAVTSHTELMKAI